MDVTVANFKTFLPTFKDVAERYIELYLEQAALSCDAELYGDKQAMAVFYTAAHMMALNPEGGGAKMTAPPAGVAATVYSAHLKSLQLGIGACGFRVC